MHTHEDTAIVQLGSLTEGVDLCRTGNLWRGSGRRGTSIVHQGLWWSPMKIDLCQKEPVVLRILVLHCRSKESSVGLECLGSSNHSGSGIVDYDSTREERKDLWSSQWKKLKVVEGVKVFEEFDHGI